MSQVYKPHHYQDFGFNHIMQNYFCGLFMDMGLGKTVVSLTAINALIYQEAEVERVLVVGTKRIVRGVWKQEAQKWDHLKHLKVSIVWGTPAERIAALRVKADVYLINRENLVWLVNLFQSKFPFKVVIIDESSSFKSHKSQRFKALKLVRKYIERIVLLTGTPAPNGLMDLWAQLFLLDEGERLEKTLTGYRERYFTLKNPGEMFSGYRPRKGAEQSIYEKIDDICISMKARDYLELPDLIENDIQVVLEKSIQDKYERFEEDCIMEIANQEITALNAAALNTKLMQFANGAIYHEDRSYSVLHDAKLDALEEIIDEANGNSVFVAYSFQHDLKRILKRFPHARMLNSPQDEEDWNMGKIPLLVAHPASAGHGLNLQNGGHIIVWFGLTWNLEHYQQFIARLMRQGQTLPVIVHRLITMGTIDEKAAISLLRKEREQDYLMEAIKALIIKHKRR